MVLAIVVGVWLPFAGAAVMLVPLTIAVVRHRRRVGLAAPYASAVVAISVAMAVLVVVRPVDTTTETQLGPQVSCLQGSALCR